VKGTGVEVGLAVPVPVVADVAPTVVAEDADTEVARELLSPEEEVLGMLDWLAAAVVTTGAALLVAEGRVALVALDVLRVIGTPALAQMPSRTVTSSVLISRSTASRPLAYSIASYLIDIS